MTSERYEKIEQLYHLALEQTGATRASFLENACGGDKGLLREIESLLALSEAAEQFMEVPASELVTSALVQNQALPTVPNDDELKMVGQTVSHYRITGKLGEGGMATVYAAADERLHRSVAIKILRASTLEPEVAPRLWREARTAAGISHPNVCQIYEVGEEAGDLFIVMELLEGESLSQRIARGPLSIQEAIQIALEVLGAVSELHRRQLIHRDLKPSNVLLTPRGAKLVDFGLTRTAESTVKAATPATDAPITQPGTLLGTPNYMAPEQVQGKVIDTRADLFAVGAILFQMLTGKLAFPGATMLDVFHAVVYEQPPAFGGSPAIVASDRIVRRALAKRPDDRYETADQMAQELRTALLIPDTGEATRIRPMTRLIVLPFQILRPDDDTDFLAFSLPEAITASLSGLQSLVVRSSAVASRFACQPLDMKRISAEAEVDVVLTGTVLRAGEQLLVSVQLAEAPSGAVIWSQATRNRLRNVFELQDDLVHGIVKSLALPLTAREQKMLNRDVPVSATAYEFYLRANQLSYDWHHHHLARDLYLKSLEQDPAFAPAWARLGRCCFTIGKLNGDAAHVAQAEAAFKRALELNSDLALAQNFYARMEADQGRPIDAMARLLRKAGSNQTDAEMFSSLVYACRYCGLLDASAAAHREARRLDPQVRTSISRTYYLMGEYRLALETNNVADVDIDALALAALGRETEAIAHLSEEEHKDMLLLNLRLMLASLRALFEGKNAESLDALNKISTSFGGPEGRYYLGRHLARLGETGRALAMLGEAVDRGFFCYPGIVRDPWLDRLRNNLEFVRILRRAEERWRQSIALFAETGGEEILGITHRV